MGSSGGRSNNKDKEELVDPNNPRSGQYDPIRQRTLGYNDFLPGGIYGPAPNEPQNVDPDYPARREHWNKNALQDATGLRDTSDVSDQAVQRSRAQRQAEKNGQFGRSNKDGFSRSGWNNSDQDRVSMALKDSVGPLGLNAAPDVVRVQEGLNAAGLNAEIDGVISTETVNKTKTFQQENGLKVDGQVNPGGPTEKALQGRRNKSTDASKTSGRTQFGQVSIERQVETLREMEAAKAARQRQQQAAIAKARQRTSYASAWQQELAKPPTERRTLKAFAADYHKANGITSGYAPNAKQVASLTPPSTPNRRTDTAKAPAPNATQATAAARHANEFMGLDATGGVKPNSPVSTGSRHNWSKDLLTLHSGEVQPGIAVGQKLDRLAKTNPKALNGMPDELQSFQKGYSAKLHSNYMSKEAPKIGSPDYASEKRRYDRWLERRKKEALREGLKKAGSHFHRQAFFKAPTATTANLVSGVMAMQGRPLSKRTQIGINKQIQALDIPKGYRSSPGVQMSQLLGETLSFAGGLYPGPAEAAGKVSRSMSLENASAKSQTQNAWGHAALNAFPGVHTKIKGAALREYVKAKSKRDLLSPVYDKAIGFGETVTEFVSGWGMDMALDQGAQKKEKGKEED